VAVTLLLILLSGVFCLAPLALYLSWLGSVNRRPRPTVVGGGWDFAWLLAGLSGFLLFGGGLLVAAVQSSVRYAFRGNWQRLQEVWGQEGPVWGVVALSYLLFVGGLAALVIASRLRTLSVYNIDRPSVESAIETALAEAGVPASRFGNVWSNGGPVVAIDFFSGLRHATVRLLSQDPRLREELERNLRQRLTAAAPADAPVATLLYSAAIGCGVAAASSAALVALFIFIAARR
jgi:hypothetical protein